MKEQTFNEIRKLKKERQEFIESVNGLEKRAEKKEITPYEKDFLIKTITKGSTAKAHLYEINKKISELEEKENKESEKFKERFKYTKQLAVSSIIMMVFLVSFYTYLFGSTTGLFALENVKEYDIRVNQTLDESAEFYFKIPELTNNTQNITSLKLSGHYSGDFTVYLVKEDENGKQVFTIYSSGDMKSISSITGLATGHKKDITIPDTPIDDVEENIIEEVIEEVDEEIVVDEVVDEPIAGTVVDVVDEESVDVVEEDVVDEVIVDENVVNPVDDVIDEVVVDEEIVGSKIIYFNKQCVDTCDLELNPYNLSILIDISENSSLKLDYITFSQRIEENPIVEEIINETINETILNETILNETIMNETIIVNETIINETLINETINQTINIEKIDPEIFEELNSKEKVRVIIQKKDGLQTVYISPREVSKGKKNLGIASNVVEISYDEIKTRYPATKEFTEEELSQYQNKKLLDKKTNKPIEVDQETIDILALTTDIEQLTELSLMSEVEYIAIDREFSALTTESINITKILDTQNLGYDGSGVNVCVLDTGLNAAAIGIDSQKVVGYNFVDDTEDYSDNNGHGTKVVYPLITSAPGISLIIAKVISDSGIGYASDILAGIEYCQLNNASIISASIGGGGFEGYCDEDIVASKINYIAENESIITIASTGNDGNNLVKSPACARNALAVAASTKSDNLSALSNYNGATLLLAPGENIQTIDNNGNSVVESGTSMSVPFVTATAAMLLENKENNESFTAEQLKRRIINTGDLIEHPVIGVENNYRRFSILNAYNAITNNITNDLIEENVFVAYGQAQNFTPSVTTAYANAGSASSDCSNGGGNGWSNLPNIISLNDAYAETDVSYNNNMYDWEVYLVKGGTAVGSNQATMTFVDAVETGFTFGAATNMWGTTLTPADVESSSFGAAISFYDMDIDETTCFILTDSHGINVQPGAQIRGVELYTEYFYDEKTGLVNVDGMQLRVYYEYAISAKGTPYVWSWATVNGFSTGSIISGTPYDWTWRSESSGSGRMVRNGTAYNWAWVPE